MTGARRLGADAGGYSRLMDEDETGTFYRVRRIEAHFVELIVT